MMTATMDSDSTNWTCILKVVVDDILDWMVGLGGSGSTPFAMFGVQLPSEIRIIAGIIIRRREALAVHASD